MWILIGICLAGWLLVGVLWLPLYFSQCSYFLSGLEVVVSVGVIFKKRQVMRMSAIQYATLITTPFSRVSGLNFLLINGCGGSLLLKFISRADGEEILRIINAHLLKKPG